MPDVPAAYRELLQHAAATPSPQTIRPVAADIVTRWQQAVQSPADQLALRQALLDLRKRLIGAARRAQGRGRMFELSALEEAIHVLDAANLPPGATPP